MSRLDLVVFDWDGTLVDSTGAIAGSIRLAVADLGLTVPTLQQASHVIGLGLHDALRLAVPDLPDSRMGEFSERYRAHYSVLDGQLRPFAGIEPLLTELAGTDAWLAVATGKSRAGLNRALEQTGWSRRFVTTRCADEGPPKPAPWMLDDICAELGVAPQRAVMIGDTTHDLAMARASGTRSVAVTWGAHPADQLSGHGCDACLASVAQLRDWLAVELPMLKGTT